MIIYLIILIIHFAFPVPSWNSGIIERIMRAKKRRPMPRCETVNRKL
jgi:hypothetical protein